MSFAASEPASTHSRIVRCGKYHLIATLGQGGMADVFLGVAQGPAGFNKLQVIKRLRENLAEEGDFLDMFLDEAKLAARLSHRNVVQTNEVDEVNGQYFIAMEYLDGQPLNRIIRRNQKLGDAPLGIMLRIVADALAGLHYAHELADYDGTPLGIVHRDASPHNIFVTYEGETKVVDFGIAKAATRSVETRQGLLKGKIPYMAPEQAAPDQKVDRLADIFVLGEVLWEVIASRKMWEGFNEMEIYSRLTHGEIPRLHEVCPDAPPALIEICARATAPDPANRYATAAEMRGAILGYLEQSGQRVETEDVGHFVSKLFADRRSELKKTIDRQLSKLNSMSYPALPESSLFDPSWSQLPQINASTDSSEHTPSHQKAIRRSQPPGEPSRSYERPPSAPSGVVARPSAEPPATWKTWVKSPRAKQLLPLLGIGVVTALVTVGALRLGRKGAPAGEGAAPAESAQVTSPSATVAPPPPPPEPVPTVARIELRVEAVPSSAVLSLDDAQLPSNPFSAKFPSDGSGHKILAEAPGYLSQSRIVIFDKDVALTLELEPTSASRGGRGRPAVSGPLPAPAPPSTGAQGAPGSSAPLRFNKRLDSAPWVIQSAPAPATSGTQSRPMRAFDAP